MNSRGLKVACLAALVVVMLSASFASAQKSFTIEQILSYALPSNLVSARKVDRLAWCEVERGIRNVYTASAPSFKPVRITDFMNDDGKELSAVRISDDGGVVAFVRGQGPNRDGWIANPASEPTGGRQEIWAADTRKAKAWKLTSGNNPILSPDGKWVLFVRDGQIFESPVNPGGKASGSTGDEPLIKAWGINSDPRWSPDSRKIAFVSNRTDHSLIVIYDHARHELTYVSPSVDRDTSPTWSPDGTKIAFMRRPGASFLQITTLAQQQTPQGRGTGSGRGNVAPQGGRGGQAQTAQATQRTAPAPIYQRAELPGGYNLAILVADVATGTAREVWHPSAKEPSFAPTNRIDWAGDSLVFLLERNNYRRYYSLPAAGGENVLPTELTPGDGEVPAADEAETLAFSSDGKLLYYGTNVNDIDRRHIWKVSTSGGTPTQLTTGTGIENYPAALASGTRVACFYADARQPKSVALVPSAGGQASIVSRKLPAEFPLESEVVPEQVILTAEDGLKFHNQVFVPKDIKPGERRPALVFTHGGPSRQMLLGYHYSYFYHMAYAMNQYFASMGYVVISVNYRSGIGYGTAFRNAPNSGQRGSAEYKDLVAAARYLQSRPDVDPKRIGLYGLSYGGLMTAMGLARNSDIFAAGVDIAGVHLWGNSLDPENVAFKASSISTIDKWTSPVLLVQGDDDRNVQFSQTVGLVQLLRARNVHYELIVFPDEVHDFLVFQRWLKTFNAADDFFNRFLRK